MPITTTDIILIIGVVSGNLILVINAYFAARGRTVINTKADAAVATANAATLHGAAAAQRVEDLVTARADSQDLLLDQIHDATNTQDHKLDQIHEATNGGVQALRDQVRALEALLKSARADTDRMRRAGDVKPT